MTKGITGLDRKQLNRLVELVVGDDEIVLAPRILGPLQAVRAALMYLRTNTSQEAIADVMGASQPTISRAIAVVTRIIARVLGPLLATAEQVARTGLYIIDGTLLPCWSWKSEPCLWSQAQAHWCQSAGHGGPGRAPAVGLRPPAGKHP